MIDKIKAFFSSLKGKITAFVKNRSWYSWVAAATPVAFDVIAGSCMIFGSFATMTWWQWPIMFAWWGVEAFFTGWVVEILVRDKGSDKFYGLFWPAIYLTFVSAMFGVFMVSFCAAWTAAVIYIASHISLWLEERKARKEKLNA